VQGSLRKIGASLCDGSGQDKLPANFLRETGLLRPPVCSGGLPRQACPPLA